MTKKLGTEKESGKGIDVNQTGNSDNLNISELKLQDQGLEKTGDQKNHDVLKDINPEELRLGGGSSEDLFKPKKDKLPIKLKPGRGEFVRTPPPGKNLMGNFLVLIGNGLGSDHYLVHPKYHTDLTPDAKAVTLTLAVNQCGEKFLWMVKAQIFDRDEWGATRHEALIRSRTEPISMRSNMLLGRYDIIVAKNSKLFVPEWPDVTIDELIKDTFRDKFICSLDHPAVKRLRGETL